MASPNNDTRQFLFDGPDIAIPDDKKPELIKILKQRYEEIYNSSNIIIREKIFLKKFNEQYQNVTPDVTPEFFEKKLNEVFSNNKLTLTKDGFLKIEESQGNSKQEKDTSDVSIINIFLSTESTFEKYKEIFPELTIETPKNPAKSQTKSGFLFDSNPSIPIPNHQKEKLVEILAKKYEELYKIRNSDGQVKFFFKFFTPEFNKAIGSSIDDPNPDLFKTKLKDFLLEQELKIQDTGYISITNKRNIDENLCDKIEVFDNFLLQKSAILTPKEFEELQIKSTSDPVSSNPDKAGIHQQPSNPLTQLTQSFSEFSNNYSRALNSFLTSSTQNLSDQVGDLLGEVQKSFEKLPTSLTKLSPPKLEPPSLVQNFHWLTNSIQEIKNPLDGLSLQGLIDIFQKPTPESPTRSSSQAVSSQASSAERMLREKLGPRKSSATTQTTQIPSTRSSSSEITLHLSRADSVQRGSSHGIANLSRANTLPTCSSPKPPENKSRGPKAPTKAPPSPVAIFGVNAIQRAKDYARNKPGQPFVAGGYIFTYDLSTYEMIIEKSRNKPSNNPATRRCKSPNSQPQVPTNRRP
jgi:hypothetical protein